MAEAVHTPVLCAEVLRYLSPRAGGRYVDATIDGGGHATAILQATAPTGIVLGIDRDPELLTALQVRLAAEVATGRLQLAAGNFRELTCMLASRHLQPVDGVLFDLGLSSFHLDASGRGFTFMRDEPLDMRFDPTDDALETAAALCASRSADELAALFQTYGEERFASRIARSLVAHRLEQPIATTNQLFKLIEQSLPAKIRWRAARHAARIFQALRIAVNDELGAIADALPQALAALAPAGRLVVIAFHSLEDRMVKNFLRDEQHAGRLRVLTKKPVQPSEAERAANPRAASAKLRAAEKI